MNYRDAVALADAYDAALRADDPRLRNHVVVIHEEGAFMHFKWAFVLECSNFVMVFTEHQGHYVFDKEDLVNYWQYKETKIKKYDGTQVANSSR